MILFDLYGTLILTHKHSKAWDAWHRRLINFIEALGGAGKASAANALIKDFSEGDDKPADVGLTPFEYKISEFLRKIELSATSSELTRVANELCCAWQEHLEVDPASGNMFNRLRGSYRVGLVTNFDHPPHIRGMLEENGLGKHFETIVVSGEEGIKKPDPEILMIACRNLECDPERTTYVGDSIVDYQAASAAGITPVIIRRNGQKEVETSRGPASKYGDTDRLLHEKARSGELKMIGELDELPDILRRRP